MKSDKVFWINAVFNLPDDFEGTTTEALELLLKRRKSKESEGKLNTNNAERHLDSKNGELIDNLWEDQNSTCYMDSSICEYDREKHEWNYR